MIVKSIRLRNFRLIEDSTLIPLEKGITGLVGKNGAGKSAFLIGLRWALFGTRPEGEVNKGLIRQASLDEEDFECFVDVSIEKDGKVLNIIRKMSPRGTVSAKVEIDGSIVAKDSSGAANKAVLEFLGQTEDVFSTSHIIGQEELNGLVNAKPSSRRTLIESSAGIDILSESVKNASTDLSSFPHVDEIAEEVLSEARNNIESLEEEIESLKNKLSKTTVVDPNPLYATLSNLREQRELYQKTISEKNALEGMLLSLGDPEPIKEEIQVPPKDTEAEQGYYEAKSAVKEIAEIESSLRQIPAIEFVDMSEIDSRIINGSTWIAERETALKSLIEAMSNKDFHRRKKEEEKATQAKILSIQSFANERVKDLQERAQKEISGLQRYSLDDIHEKCPLCGSQVSDPEKLREERTLHIAAIEDETKNSIDNIIASSKKDIEEIKAKSAISIQEIEKEEEDLEKENTSLRQRLEQEILKGKSHMNQLLEEKHKAEGNNRLIEQRRLLEEKKSLLNDKAAILEAMKERVTTNEKAINEALKYNESVRAFNNEQERIIKEQKNLQAKLSSLPECFPVTQEQIEEADKKFLEAKDSIAKYEALTLELNSKEEMCAWHKNRYQELQKQNEEAKKQNERRFLQKSTVDLLRNYREEMLATLGPNLEESMSSLISSMTEGEYVGVRLDDSFGVYVTSSVGEERPVSSLSGGEKALVSLAMRMSLGGESSGLLWMDEVSSALDGDRLKKFMAGLHRLDRQIIVIDHRETAMEDYDKVILFERKPNSSKII